MVVRLRRALERDPQQGGKTRREGGRKNRVAFDYAGIAVGGLLARIAAVDERDAQALPGELQRGGGADDAGAQHNDIGARHNANLTRVSTTRSAVAACI